MTVKQILFQHLDSCSEKIVSGWDIYDEIKPLTGQETYPTTLIRYCKEYADISGADFFCVNKQKSIYRFIPGFGIGSAKIEGIE